MIDLCICDAENRLYENNVIDENERVIFLVYNIALTEKYENGIYRYTAIILDSLKRRTISKRKKQIVKDDYEHYAHKIRELFQKNMNLTITRYERAKKLLYHIFFDILPAEGFSYRQNQADLAMEILEALEMKNIGLMEAEVGTGKTHAYIIAVVIYNLFHDIRTTTLISTSTIALQRAITEEYIPQISDILMKYRIVRNPLTFMVRKGKAHYVCDLKLKTYLQSLRKNSHRKDVTLIRFLKELMLAPCDKIDLDMYAFTKYVKERIGVTNKCSEFCSKYDNCRFIKFMQQCMNGRYYFQIANHNYVFADLMSHRPLLPKYKIVIFDEAHKLYDAAKQIYGYCLRETAFADLIKYIRESGEQLLMPLGDAILFHYLKLFSRVKSRHKQREAATVDDVCVHYMRELTNRLDDMIDCVYNCNKAKSQMKKYQMKKMCERLRNTLQAFIMPENLICWYEKEGIVYSLCAIPKELGKMICSKLWNRDVLSILTSGTLSANSDFAFLKTKLGIAAGDRNMTEISRKSPFDYRKNALIYIPEHMPFPNVRNDKYIQAVISEIDKLLRAAHGHSLLLFTSYRLMELVFCAMNKKEYDYPLFIMKKGGIDTLKEFRASGNGVLFASDMAGEGVDIVGDTLSNLIIVKLPFAVPDAISKYEQSVVGGLEPYLREINTPNMIIKLKQYAGRLIRSESDTGVIAILDSRVTAKGKYRNIVLESLFDAEVTSHISDVERFMLDKKDAVYFE